MKQHHNAIVLVAIMLLGMAYPINATSHKTTSIDSLWSQVKKHYKSSPELALDYAKQLQAEAKKQDNREQETSALWTIGYINKKLGNYNESMEAFFEVLPLYESLENDKFLAETYYNIGNIFTEVKNDKGAEAFYKKALDFYVLFDNKKRITQVSYQLGKCYASLNEFEKAEKHLNLALKLSKKHHKALTQKTYNWLGILAYKKGDFELAIKHYNESLSRAIGEENQEEETMLLYNLGEAYFNAKDIVQAKTYAAKALALSKSIENLDKQVKPQILLAEIALNERGENKEEVLALVSTIALFDVGILNSYLLEGLDYVSTGAYQQLLSLDNKNTIISHYAPQTMIANELYENTKTQLLQHSIQISIDKVKHQQKMRVMAEREGLKNWMIVLSVLVFLGIIGLLIKYYRKRGLKFKKQHAVKLSKMTNRIDHSKALHDAELGIYITELTEAKEHLLQININLKRARKKIKKKEEENLEKSLIIDLKDAEFKEIDDENTGLVRQKVHTNEIMSAMEDKLLEGHDLMHQMNKYIWDVIIELQHKGYDVPPPLWDLRDDRDN